jgi:hypothetical protein
MTKTNKTQNHITTHKNGQPRDIGCCVMVLCFVCLRHVSCVRNVPNVSRLSIFMCCVMVLCFVCLRPVSCVPNVANISRLSIFMCCVMVLCFVCLRHVSCIPIVPNVSRLFVFVVCLVYPMFPMSLGWTNNLETLATLGTQDT